MFIDADRGDHRNDVGTGQRLQKAGIDLLGLAHEAEIDLLLAAGRRIAAGAQRALGPDQLAVATRDADGGATGPVDRRSQLLVDRPREDHLDDLDRLVVRDAQPVDEARLDREAVEHLGDLRAAAMDDDRIDADLLEQHDVARELGEDGGVAHGMAAVFDHDCAAGVAAHEGQGLGEEAALGERFRRDAAGGLRSWFGHGFTPVGRRVFNRRRRALPAPRATRRCRRRSRRLSGGSRDVRRDASRSRPRVRRAVSPGPPAAARRISSARPAS